MTITQEDRRRRHLSANTVTFNDLEFRYYGETTISSGLARLTTRGYVVWSGEGDDAAPVDQFVIFRWRSNEPWTAWCADTHRPERREWRRALADHLNSVSTRDLVGGVARAGFLRWHGTLSPGDALESRVSHQADAGGAWRAEFLVRNSDGDTMGWYGWDVAPARPGDSHEGDQYWRYVANGWRADYVTAAETILGAADAWGVLVKEDHQTTTRDGGD